jgi:Polysaccharide biosynthesis C-terminal domain
MDGRIECRTGDDPVIADREQTELQEAAAESSRRAAQPISPRPAFSLAREVAAAGMTAIVIFIVVRGLGVHGDALLALAGTASAIALAAASVGISWSISRVRAGWRWDVEEAERLFHEALRVKVIAYCLFATPLIVWRAPIAEQLLGWGDAADAHLLAAIAPLAFLAGLSPIVGLSARFAGSVRARLLVAIAALGIGVGSAVLLVPRHGAVGAAISFDLCLGFYVLVHVALCARSFRVPAHFAWTVGSSVTAAITMGLVLVLIGRDGLSRTDWLLGGAGGFAAYTVMLVFTRELRSSDLGPAWRLFQGGVPRAQPASGTPAAAPPPGVYLALEAPAAERFPALAPGPFRPGVTDRDAAQARRLVCEIVWDVGASGGAFQLRPHGEEQATAPEWIAGVRSEHVPWTWRMPPPPTPAATRAHHELVKGLVETGWERCGRGDEWFAQRFRAPEHLSLPVGAYLDWPAAPSEAWDTDSLALVDTSASVVGIPTAPWGDGPNVLEPLPVPAVGEKQAAPDTAVGADTARVRLALSAMSLASVVLAGAAVAVGATQLRAASLLFFCLVGLGSAPWQLNGEYRLPARMTLTLVTGLAVLTLVPMTLLAIHSWHPVPAFIEVALFCTLLHVMALRSALADLRSMRALPALVPPIGVFTMALAGAGAGLCIAAALTHRHLTPGFYGFLTHIGPVWYLGLACLLVALVLARGDDEAEMATPVLLLAVVLTLTPALVYDGPRSQAAAKHVDLVTQIRTQHALLSTFDIYNNWSGFFAFIASLCDITGIRNVMKFATFWPALIAVFRVALLRFLFGQILRSTRQAWFAVAIAVLADSVGQDYFSPQSVGFLLGLAIFGLALSNLPDARRLLLILVGGCVLAMTHQLSPYTVGGTLVVLVALKQVRPWWTPLLVLGPAVLWAAAHYQALQGFLSINLIGRPNNFRPPATAAAAGLQRLPVVRETVWALLFAIAFVGTLALIGLLRNRRDRRAWALAICPGVGLALCAVNPYGQESIFRAVIFALPWLAALGASTLPARLRPSIRIGALAGAVALTIAFVVSSFGLDATNVIRPADVSAYAHFLRAGGPRPTNVHYVLSLGAGDLPTFLPVRLGGHVTVGRDRLDMPLQQAIHQRPNQEMQRLTAKFLRYSREPLRDASLYAIWSPVQADYGWAYAIESRKQFAALRGAFSRSPYWQQVFARDGTVLFRFRPAAYAARAR